MSAPADADGADHPGDEDSQGPLSRLALRVQAGDRAALEGFAAAIHGYLLWAVRAQVRSPARDGQEIDDLAATAWITILENLATVEVRGDEALKAWLRRIVSTRIADLDDRARAAKRDATRSESLDELLRGGDHALPRALRSGDAEHVRAFWTRVECREIVTALAQIPEELAQAVWMVDFDERGWREAGRLLGITESMVRRRYARGKAALAALLGGDRG